jgi:hypothetical protein
MGIHHSFKIGNEGESFIALLMGNANIECEKHDDFATKEHYDLVCRFGRTNFSCEVKFDVMAVKTGNLAIEVFNTRKDTPSGLQATKADIWAHVILDGDNKVAFISSVKKLKEYCNIEQPVKIISNGGDKNAMLMLYRSESILESIFHNINLMDEKELKTIIKELLK